MLAGAGAALAGGCATATVTLQSSPPKAQIFVSSLGGSAPKLIGETPFVTSAPQLKSEYGGSGPAVIEFRKDGYNTTKTVITDLGAMELTVSSELRPTTGLEDQEHLNDVVNQVFEGQRLARAGRQQEALSKLKQVEKLAPALAASYELEGGIFYLQKKYKEALDAYSIAARYDPRDAEAVRMRNLLETTLGVRRSTASTTKTPPTAAGAGGTK